VTPISWHRQPRKINSHPLCLMSSCLTWVLRVKFAATLLLWALPALLLRPERFLEFGFAYPVPVLWVRLTGMAYLSPALGYWHSLQSATPGNLPAGHGPGRHSQPWGCLCAIANSAVVH
jgi:hypothetical protein